VDDPKTKTHTNRIGACEEKKRLADKLLEAIHELNILHRDQMKAIIDDDSDFPRFDLLIHLTQEKKDNSKYAWIAHVESHGCADAVEITNLSEDRHQNSK